MSDAAEQLGAFVALALLTVTGVQAAVTDPFDAHFAIDKSGFSLGKAHFWLSRDKKTNCYIYRGTANPNTLAAMFIGHIDETSRFCLVDGRVRPDFFRHHIDGKPKKSYTLTFNWAQHAVRYHSETGKRKTYKLPVGAQDPLSLQIAARRWAAQAGRPSELGHKTFTLVDDDGAESYHLAVSPGGRIKTPGGTFDTLEVARTGRHHHALAFWLARGADWIPIQVRELKNGDTAFNMKLQRLTRDRHYYQPTKRSR